MLSALYIHLTPFVFNQQREIISFTRITLFTEKMRRKIQEIQIVFSTVGNPEIFV